MLIYDIRTHLTMLISGNQLRNCLLNSLSVRWSHLHGRYVMEILAVDRPIERKKIRRSPREKRPGSLSLQKMADDIYINSPHDGLRHPIDEVFPDSRAP